MTKTGILVLILLIVILLGGLVFLAGNYKDLLASKTPTPEASPTVTPLPTPRPVSDLIKVFTPVPGQTVKSPLTIKGEARGVWYFEASFPITLVDEDGKELAKIAAQASGSWMTENFVPFSVELKFPKPKTAAGLLIFEKDNPSGLPENAATYSFPVNF